MHLEEPRAQIGSRDTPISRAKSLASKALVVLGGAVVLASAFAISLVFLAITLVVVLTFGGYVWWKTRDLRKHMRERMQAHSQPRGQVIEGEVISQEPPTQR